MFRLFVVSFIIIFLASLSASFDGVQANKKDARESLTPGQSYHLYMPSPFGKTYEGFKNHQRHEQKQLKRHWYQNNNGVW